MPRRLLPGFAFLVALVTAPAVAQTPSPETDAIVQPDTRQAVLRELRRQRSTAVGPHDASTLERLLSRVENEQTLENLFDEPSPSTGGFYLTLGNITTGAGLTLGTGYNGRARLGRQVELSVRGAISQRLYWKGEVEAALSRVARGRAFASLLARRQDFTQEDYFGPGPDSVEEDRVNFRLLETEVEASGGVRATRWLSMGGGIGFLTPSVGTGKDTRYPSIEEEFTDAEAPGLSVQPDFYRYRIFADFDFADPVANPRTGGRYRIGYSYFHDLDFDRYSFERWELDIRQYVSFLRGRRVLAFRGLASFSDPRVGHTVPFYYQQWLGGSHSLRGFKDFRLRDRHLVLLQAEYRWEIFPTFETVLFYDAGKVAPFRRELSFEDFQDNWGTGFRVGTDGSGVFFRVDWAIGGRDGQNVMIKFSNVF